MVTLEGRVSRLEGRFDSLATKADLERMGGELRAEMGEMRGGIKALRILMMSAIGVMGLALAGLNVILQLAG